MGRRSRAAPGLFSMGEWSSVCRGRPPDSLRPNKGMIGGRPPEATSLTFF